MADDPIAIENMCCDLVSHRKYEAFVKALLLSPKGQWHNVRGLATRTGTSLGEYEPSATDVFVTWLDDAASTEGFVSIIFHHYESIWTTCAHYNRDRLVG
jgi:hypothetical protein